MKQNVERKIYIYGAREISSGKLVSNLVNPRRKYWDREGNAKSAVTAHNRRYSRGWESSPGECEVVRFELVEAPYLPQEEN